MLAVFVVIDCTRATEHDTVCQAGGYFGMEFSAEWVLHSF
jgi:hypothetical protein